jgi:hypothetical protein
VMITITHKEPRKISNQNYSQLEVLIDQTLNLLNKLYIIHSNHNIHIHGTYLYYFSTYYWYFDIIENIKIV